MKRLLTIRSASFQQLDNNFPLIRSHFPEHEIHLLTHEHGRKLAEKYAFVSKVIVYPTAGNFSSAVHLPELKGDKYDDVLVPVTNLSGAGFANVFAFALSLSAGSVHQCNLIGKIIELKAGEIRWMIALDRFYRAAGFVFGTLLGLLATLWFMFSTNCQSAFGKPVCEGEEIHGGHSRAEDRDDQ